VNGKFYIGQKGKFEKFCSTSNQLQKRQNARNSTGGKTELKPLKQRKKSPKFMFENLRNLEKNEAKKPYNCPWNDEKTAFQQHKQPRYPIWETVETYRWG